MSEGKRLAQGRTDEKWRAWELNRRRSDPWSPGLNPCVPQGLVSSQCSGNGSRYFQRVKDRQSCQTVTTPSALLGSVVHRIHSFKQAISQCLLGTSRRTRYVACVS